MPVQGYRSNPPPVPDVPNLNPILAQTVNRRNDIAPGSGGSTPDATSSAWSGQGGVVGWAHFGDNPQLRAEDSYWSLQPNSFGQVPEEPLDPIGGLMNNFSGFIEAQHHRNLNSLPGVGNVVVTAPYFYSPQGLRIPSVTVGNASDIFSVAGAAQNATFGQYYPMGQGLVPAGTALTLLAPSDAAFAPYETVTLTVDVAGIVDAATRYFGHFVFYFPSGTSRDMPYWANP
jgi:hypothetical protein